MLKRFSNSFFSVTDSEDPVGNREPQDKIPYRIDMSLVHKVDYEERKPLEINLCTSEKSNDSENENLQLKLFVKQNHL